MTVVSVHMRWQFKCLDSKNYFYNTYFFWIAVSIEKFLRFVCFIHILFKFQVTELCVAGFYFVAQHLPLHIHIYFDVWILLTCIFFYWFFIISELYGIFFTYYNYNPENCCVFAILIGYIFSVWILFLTS